MKRRKTWRLSGVAIAAVGGSCAANAAPGERADHFFWSVGAGVDRSDNITHVDTNEQSETTVNANLMLDVQEHRPRAQLDLASDLSYRNYLNNIYQDEVIGGLNGKLGLSLVPEHFIWNASDNFGQTRRNAFTPESPLNRENYNIFTTGPDFIAKLGARTQAELSGRWSDIRYDKQGVDNNRYSVDLTLTQSLSEALSTNIRGSANRVAYDSISAISDYEIREASAGFESKTRRTSTSIQSGYTKVIPRIGEETGGLLFNLEFTQSIGARSEWLLRGGTQYTDSANSLVLDQNALGVSQGTSDLLVTTDTFKSDYVYTSLRINSARTTFVLGGHWRRERHQKQVGQDVDLYGLDARISRHLTARMQLGFDGLYESQKFRLNGIQSSDWLAGTNLTFQVTHSFHIVAQYQHLHGNSDAPYRYSENRASLSFAYGHLQ